jgi:hypothetical protein
MMIFRKLALLSFILGLGPWGLAGCNVGRPLDVQSQGQKKIYPPPQNSDAESSNNDKGEASKGNEYPVNPNLQKRSSP